MTWKGRYGLRNEEVEGGVAQIKKKNYFGPMIFLRVLYFVFYYIFIKKLLENYPGKAWGVPVSPPYASMLRI